MVSITDLVKNSERITLSSGVILLVPEGSQRQSILMDEQKIISRFAGVTLEGLWQSPVFKSDHDHVNWAGCQVYVVAPGYWNNGVHEYSVLVCGGGKAIMASLSSCGYEPDRKGHWQKIRQ